MQSDGKENPVVNVVVVVLVRLDAVMVVVVLVAVETFVIAKDCKEIETFVASSTNLEVAVGFDGSSESAKKISLARRCCVYKQSLLT